MLRRIIVLLFIASSVNCIGGRDKSKAEATKMDSIDSLYRIDLREAIQAEHNLTLNQLADDIRFINLEFQREAALSTLSFRADRVDDKLIVSSHAACVMQFDTLGRFEKRLVGFGRERSELNRSLYKSTFSNGELLITQGQKVIALGADSKRGYISEKYYFGVASLGESGYVALPNLGYELRDDDIHLDFLDCDFNHVESVKPTHPKDVYYRVPEGFTGRTENCILAPSHSGKALYKAVFSDIIYLVNSSNNIEPYIELEYGDFMPNVENITDQKKIHLSNIAENRFYIFIKFGFQDSAYTIIWDKRNAEIVAHSKIDYSDNNTLINSNYFVDYVTPRGKKIKVGIAGIADQTIYCAPRIADAVEFIDGMTLEDNPLVIEVKLKGVK